MSMLDERQAHAQRCEQVSLQLHLGSGAAAPLGLAKSTSNLFRDRVELAKQRLDMSGFGHVIEVDAAQHWVDAEGLANYETLVDATLPHGCMPSVVPQLKTITAGGATAGVGIEATSFREGLVHHTLLELDVLLPDGDVVLCRPDNEHRDLFFAFPNSYGTLGYALRVRLRTRPVLPYVLVRHRRFETADDFFEQLAGRCQAMDEDFVDAVVFDRHTLVLSTAHFCDAAAWPSDYGYERIYYRSLLEKDVDYLRTRDYLWRWDTDWFWCSKNFGLRHPWMRRLFGRRHLNSATYTKLMRLNARWGLTRCWDRLRGLHPESVIQDVNIPIEQAGAFVEFLLREISILPVWVCPFREPAAPGRFTLYPLAPGALYVNFGFWDTVRSRTPMERGHFNRLVEHEVMRLGGIKSLYSESGFTRQEFAQIYDRLGAYVALKARYDPQHRLLGLYEKCVLGA